MNIVTLFMILFFQSGEKMVELKDIVYINNICYTIKDTATPFTGSVVTYNIFDKSLLSKISYKNGIGNGPYITWWGKDKVKSIKNLVNEMEQGEYLEYFESGKIAIRGQYKDGDESGTWYYYDEEGKIVDKKVYP